MHTKFILMHDLFCTRCVRQIKIHLHSKHTDGSSKHCDTKAELEFLQEC